MASLASSAVTVNQRFKFVGTTGGNKMVVDSTLVLTGQGGTSNKITAAVLGLASVDAILSCQADGNTTVHAEPSYDRTYVLLYAYNSASAADVTDTIRLVALGQEAQ